MKVKVLAFGIARDITGDGEIEIDVPEHTTAAQLRGLLTAQFPRLGGLKSFLLAVNNEYAAAGYAIAATDEVAIIPPVSGG